jgi:hypothetical protein
MDNLMDENPPNIFGGINDFLDSRNSEGDVHGRHTGKVKRFQRHLCSWFSNALTSKRANLHDDKGKPKSTKVQFKEFQPTKKTNESRLIKFPNDILSGKNTRQSRKYSQQFRAPSRL